MTSRPCVISGLGQVSTLGTGVAAFWHGLHRRDSQPTPTPDPWAKVRHSLLYQVSAPEPDRVSRFARAAAEQALADAGRTGGPVTPDPDRFAVVLGTTLGDAAPVERARVGLLPRPAGTGSPYAVAGRLADQLGARAGGTVIANACAASGYAISVGADLIRSGEVDVVLAGGTEGYSRVALACFNRMGAVDPVRCRPFDRLRAGTVFGEGAAMVVLEAADHLHRRSGAGYAELAGAGWSCDAHHVTAPEPDGAQIRRAIRQALAEAGVPADRVGCVIPHGTGTALNDAVESEAIRDLLGPAVPAYSLKALIGHTGGAAGGFAVLAAALILQHRATPPNRPLAEPDPQCRLALPTRDGPLSTPSVLVNAYAFGGNNVSLLLQEVPG